MTKSKPTLLAATLLLATLFTLSCSDGGGGNDAVVKKAKISGVSQKGPFVKGSAAILYELNKDLSQTGRIFQDIIADDKGTFEIKNVELVSPYALLKAEGYYRNEVTGQISAAPITLYAIADVTDRDNVNINILTHLEYRRVMKLVEGGMGVREAKKQAHKEILAVFGISGDFADSEDMSIFGNSESDAALLAISVLLQKDLGEGEFSMQLAEFSLAFAEIGTWDNETAKAAIADWALSADLGGIRSNILAWGLSSDVPDFGKHMTAYWTAHFGLGVCNYELQGTFKEPYYICNDGFWKKANCSEIYPSKKPCFFDERDGKHYKYDVLINNDNFIEIIIMKENLNYSRNNTLGYCYGEDMDGTNPHKDGIGCDNGYGRVYEWNVAMDGNSLQDLCPKGWRIPNLVEWNTINSILRNNNRQGSAFFGILSGNYNLDSQYPPLGWKERDVSGFAWANNSDKSFVWYGYDDLSIDTYMWMDPQTSDYAVKAHFPIRCITD